MAQHDDHPDGLSLVDVQLAFEHWRKARTRREKTPQRLKQMAHQLLTTHSRAQICKALGINAAAFKQWEAKEPVLLNATPKTEFVELTSKTDAPTTSGLIREAQNEHAPLTSIALPNGVHIKTTHVYALPELLKAASELGVTL